MHRVVRLSFLILVIAAISGSALWAETAEQILIRMFSYDPHPDSARFAEKVLFNGKLHDFEVVFVENWQTSGENGILKQISFKIQAMQGDQIIASSDTTPVATAKISKDQQIGNIKIGDISFTANVTDIEKNKSGITDLTVSFKLTYDKDSIASEAQQPDSKPIISGLEFARKLAERANAMPADQSAAKISVYRRALMAAPEAATSVEAAAFHNEINSLIAGLEKPSVVFTPFKSSEPAVIIIPQDETKESKEPVVSAVATPETTEKSASTAEPVRKTEVPDEALALYKQARTLFSQNKGPEGREALRKALEIAPAYHDALLLLGDNATENRRWARAKDAFKQALDLMDRDADTLLKYFKSCYYIGEGAEAILFLEQIRGKYPGERRIQLAVAEANFQLGDLPAAKALCEAMLAKDPDDSRANELLQRVNRLHK